MEYKYITQEVIDSGGKNITSPEMFAEARKYNIEAVKNYTKRHRTHAMFNIWMVVQFILLIYKTWVLMMNTQNEQKAEGTSTPGWRIALAAVGFFVYAGLIFYFVYVKGCHERFVVLLISVPVTAVSIGFVGIAAMNFCMAWYYNVVEEELSKELGYPSFPRLNITTFNSDSQNLSDLTYDSIREKINRDHPHDGTFL